MDVARQVQAAYNALLAAVVALETALEAMQAIEEAQSQAGVQAGVLSDCPHETTQNAATMGNPGRIYCNDCRCFVNEDGTVTSG